MSRRRRSSAGDRSRPIRVLRAAFGCLALSSALTTLPALAGALLPPNFFDQVPETTDGQAGVEADYLHFNSQSGDITASGDVGLNYAGYYATADRMVFNQRTRELRLWGNVTIVDPGGIEYTADDVEVTDGFKVAVLNAMVMVTPDGAMVTSTRTSKERAGITVLDAGTYAPCGTCVDEKGRRIGWRVRTDRITQNAEDGYTDLEQPVLEIWGYPVAWLPWLRLPDPTDERESGFRMPSFGFSEDVGAIVSVPYYWAVSRDVSLLITPSLVTGQGGLLSAEVAHSVGTIGNYSVAGHGTYQLNPGAFKPGFGDTNWRGAIQTTGRFTPTSEWTAGWSYTAFTDPAFLGHYLIDSAGSTVNEVYAEYLTADTFLDARAQEFVLLGEVTQASQNQQAAAIPSIRFDHVQSLGDAGQARVRGDLVGVHRAADDVRNNGVPYVVGYQGNKYHGTVEASWENQYILGPAAITPFGALRLDAASYDGGSALNPASSTLLTATPIAGLDVRVPFVAHDGASTHLIEPIAQIYYRGSDITNPGITNDNALSFIFDETSVFAYNKFSGSDRQETGLRANVGAHYLADFADGSYLDVAIGQTFHLAGTNGLATADAANAGVGAGLARNPSDIVAGFNAGISKEITLKGKGRLDASTGALNAAALGAQYASEGWVVGADYAYFAPDPARGISGTQQDISGHLTVPFEDYWRFDASVGWDITANKMIDYGVGVTYDDGYFEVGGRVTSTGPLIYDPNTMSYRISLKLKGPDGTGLGF